MLALFKTLTAYAAEATVDVRVAGSDVIAAKGPVGIVEAAYNLGISLAGGIAFAIVVYAGFIYATSAGNAAKQSEAKDRILQAFYGIILLLGSYILLNTLNPALTVPTFPTLERLAKVKPGEGLIDPDAWTKPVDEANGPKYTGKGPGASDITEQAARAQLNSKIILKPDPDGVRMEGVQQSTINELISLQQKCNCTITVTSCTDGTHAAGDYSHANGYKFDLRLEPTLNDFIEKSGQYENIGPRSGDNAIQWRSKSNPKIIYAKEGNHWDTVVKP